MFELLLRASEMCSQLRTWFTTVVILHLSVICFLFNWSVLRFTEGGFPSGVNSLEGWVPNSPGGDLMFLFQ